MSGIKNKLFLSAVLLICLINTMKAQDMNKYIIDEDSGEKVYTGIIDTTLFNEESVKEWFSEEYESYQPDTSTLADISEKMQNLKYIIFLGTWCGDSHREVPRFVKIAEYAEVPFSNITFYAVDHEKKAEGIDASEYNIEFVPTIIIYNNNNEIGRIIESPELSLEEDIAGIIIKEGI